MGSYGRYGEGELKMAAKQFFGKYRGVVLSTADPRSMGRVICSCPNVAHNYQTAWCAPNYTYEEDYHPPKVGDVVWIEFEQGDLKKPVWTGSWKASGEVQDTNQRIIRFRDENNKQTQMRMKDGNVYLTDNNGSKIEMKDGTVYINDIDIVELEQRVSTLEGYH